MRPSEAGKGFRISSYEQLEFMKMLWRNGLPVSPKAMKLARQLLFLETAPDGTKLGGKTGSGVCDKGATEYGGYRAKIATKEFLALEGLWPKSK